MWRFWTLPLLQFERDGMQLVYEIILVNKILRNHFLSENLQWIVRHSMLLLFISCTITGLCAISSLAIDNWGQKCCQTLGNKANPSIPIIFDRFTFKFLKNRRLLGKIKNTVSLKFIRLSFPSKKSSSERTCPYWQRIGGFHVTSSPPCWWTENKRSLISSLCLSTSSCSFHHCYLCLPRLHKNHL